jgi:hypothetical protein
MITIRTLNDSTQPPKTYLDIERPLAGGRSAGGEREERGVRQPRFSESVMGHYGFYKKFLKIIFLTQKGVLYLSFFS